MASKNLNKPISSLFDAYKKVKRSSTFRRKLKSRVNGILCVDNTSNRSPTHQSNLHFDEDENPNIALREWIDSDSDTEECDNIDHQNNSLDLSEMQMNFVQGLSKWAIQNHVSKHQVRELLSMCNQTLPFELPVDPRTIFQTARSIAIKKCTDGGLYWHRGLRDCLRSKLECVKIIPENISLNINIDGLPISESSNLQFWPILFNIHELHFIEPGVIGIYCGKGENYSNYLYTKIKLKV